MAGTSVVVAVLATGFFALVPAASSATEIRWLAAGDSYSSGTGLTTTTGLCDQADSSARPGAYTQDAFADLTSTVSNLNSPTFVACSGATSSDFLRTNDAEGHPEWTSSMGRFNLVTFTFGGDDLNFSRIMEQCLLGVPVIAPPDPGHRCPSDEYIRSQIALKLGTSYQTFLKKVANKAVTAGGNIVVLGYPKLFEPPGNWPIILRRLRSCQGISAADATQLRGDAEDLNAALSNDVSAVNAQHPNGVTVTFLDVNSGSDPGPITVSNNNQNLFEPSRGKTHDLCGSGPSWLNGAVVFDKHISFHPSALGYRAEGRLLAELIPHLPGIGSQSVGTTTTTSTTTSTSTSTTTTAPPSLSIVSVSPSSFSNGGDAPIYVPVTITGTGFLPDMSLALIPPSGSGSGVQASPPTVITSTTITFTMEVLPSQDLSSNAYGSYDLSLTEIPAGSSSISVTDSDAFQLSM
ncbi:MAG: GDSL-type esterase/lipase family protein [Acidimicrobiales bacterium]